MSTGATEGRTAAESASRRNDHASVISVVLFVILVAAAVIWPRPVLWINDVTFHADLRISTVSFLGREVPAWDVAFWAIVGLALLALFHGRLRAAGESFHIAKRDLSGISSRARLMTNSWKRPSSGAVLVAAIAICLGTWVFVDAALMAQVSRIGSPRVHDFARVTNRLGGGGNPMMIVGFFLLAGLALRRPRWTLLGCAMAVAAGVGGVLASALKPLVARSRPDLWLGPYSRVWGGESSFPSGHAIAAFAMAGAILARSRSPALRVTAVLVATSIATTRVISLRHWPSDVLTSAFLGLAIGWSTAIVFVRQEEDSEPRTEN